MPIDDDDIGPKSRSEVDEEASTNLLANLHYFSDRIKLMDNHDLRNSASVAYILLVTLHLHARVYVIADVARETIDKNSDPDTVAYITSVGKRRATEYPALHIVWVELKRKFRELLGPSVDQVFFDLEIGTLEFKDAINSFCIQAQT